MPASPLNQDTPLPPPTAMEAEALAWFSRCQQGLPQEKESEFQTWLAADPRHATLFNEFDGTWKLLGRTGEITPLVVPDSPSSLRRIPLVGWGVSVAAAVALVLTYFSWWRPNHYTGEAVTAVGSLRTLHLPDGSLVTLNTDSALTTAFTPVERRIRLKRGEAHFTVAKNSARPFFVEAGGVAVRAVGTAFNVHLGDRAVEVLVTEGKVRVDDAISGQSLVARPASPSAEPSPALGHPVLVSGQKIVVTLPAPVVTVEYRLVEAAATTVSREEIQRELAWQQRRLDFELAALSAIVAEFNRYNRHQLVIGDADLAQKRFGGSFKSDDPAGFVRMLQQNYGVTVEETETATILQTGR